ncbi:MAG: hypothetical protein B6D63_06600 [Candidatus Latescibacteria bacterium 4484_7]|nr:MAG: hypothetical protein B6D63_06600 [Candidatus Latescibacteria bacterium 4484_7]
MANEERYNEAIVHFTRAVELDPANADYYRAVYLLKFWSSSHENIYE